MRTCKEQTAYILEQLNQYQRAKKKREKVLYSSLTSAACLGVVTFSFFMLPKTTNNDGLYTSLSTVENETNMTQEKTQSTDLMAAVYFNNMNEKVMSAERRLFDPEKTYEKKMTDAEAFAYLNKDVRPTDLPKGLKYAADVLPNYSHTIFYNNDGTICFDQLHFSYAEDFEKYDPLAKGLNITASKAVSAQSDCICVWSEEMRPSDINGVKVMIGFRKMPYGPYTVVENGPNTPAGYYDLFIADFSCGGINYQIISDNFTEEEFVKAIASMLS